jgi:hypothetical protein
MEPLNVLNAYIYILINIKYFIYFIKYLRVKHIK